MDIKDKILENYKRMNSMLVEEINITSKHCGITGNHREKVWVEFFKNIIPKKFSIEQGVIIIDSNENSSNEVDIVIFDNQFTPYVLQYGSLKFIPIEAVAAVVECKSTSFEVDSVRKWSESIKSLRTNPSGIARTINGCSMSVTNKSQKATRPIKIFVSLYSTEKGDSSKFNKLKDYFDIIIKYKDSNEKEFNLLIPNEHKKLGWWLKELNCVEEEKYDDMLKIICLENNERLDELPNNISINGECIENNLKDLQVKDNTILSLIFQLNQLLMLINNPMPFPHFSYVKMFNS